MSSSAASGLCPLCGAGEVRVLFAARDPSAPDRAYEVARCGACGLVRTLGAAAGYAPGYFSIEWVKRLLPGIGSGRRRIFSVASVASGGRLLDFGSGEGGFVAAARAAGWDARGLDPFAPGADFRSLDDVARARFRPELVTLWHSLEHLDDPVAALRELTRLLAPGGAIFVAVPNFASAQARWGGSAWFHLDVPRHRIHYEPNTIVELARRAGLEIRFKSGPRAEYDPAGWIQTILNRILPEPNAFYRLLKGDKRPLAWGLFSALLVPFLVPVAVLLTLRNRNASATIEAILTSP